MATSGIAPVLVQVARVIVVRALAAVVGLSMLGGRSSCFALLASGYAFADAVYGVSNAAIFDA